MYIIFLTISLPHTNMLPTNIITQYSLISKALKPLDGSIIFVFHFLMTWGFLFFLGTSFVNK